MVLSFTKLTRDAFDSFIRYLSWQRKRPDNNKQGRLSNKHVKASNCPSASFSLPYSNCASSALLHWCSPSYIQQLRIQSTEQRLETLVEDDAKSYVQCLKHQNSIFPSWALTRGASLEIAVSSSSSQKHWIGQISASYSMSFSMATRITVSAPTAAPYAPSCHHHRSIQTTAISPPLSGEGNSTKVPGRTTTITHIPSMSPIASPIGSTTSGTLSPSAAPTADSTSSVTDEILDHSDTNPEVTPVRTLAQDHSPKPGLVAGMVLLVVMIVATVVVVLVARRRGGVGRMHAVNPPAIVW